MFCLSSRWQNGKSFFFVDERERERERERWDIESELALIYLSKRFVSLPPKLWNPSAKTRRVVRLKGFSSLGKSLKGERVMEIKAEGKEFQEIYPPSFGSLSIWKRVILYLK